MILQPEVLTLMILNAIIAFFAIIAFILSVKIYLFWDIEATTKQQYQLEKQSYLNATIIKYIFMIKLPLFLFFIFTLDDISHLLTGAMCAAGVVNATKYGMYLLMLKIFNLYIFAYWLYLHFIDIKYENLPFTKQKSFLFIFAFFLLMIEIVVEYLMFSGIDVNKMVSCCGTLFSSSATSYISNLFTIPLPLLLAFFYGVYFLMLMTYFFQNRYLFAFLNFLFIFASIISLIIFFGTYIYELPTHHCPFCMLQKDYHYIGYLLYSFLYVGTFYGMMVGLSPFYLQKNYKLSIIFNSFYTIIVTTYPIIFYIKNGVFL